MNSPLDGIIKLIDHSRKLTAEINQIAFEFLPELRDQGEKKLKYAEKVLHSLHQSAEKCTDDPNRKNEGLQLFYTIFASVIPQLEISMRELYSKLSEPIYSPISEQILTDEEIEAQLEASFNRLINNSDL